MRQLPAGRPHRNPANGGIRLPAGLVDGSARVRLPPVTFLSRRRRIHSMSTSDRSVKVNPLSLDRGGDHGAFGSANNTARTSSEVARRGCAPDAVLIGSPRFFKRTKGRAVRDRMQTQYGRLDRSHQRNNRTRLLLHSFRRTGDPRGDRRESLCRVSHGPGSRNGFDPRGHVLVPRCARVGVPPLG